MAPLLHSLLVQARHINPGATSAELRTTWAHPGDVLSVLLILGGDVIQRALAQIAGGPLTPVTFSFGWVAFSVSSLVSAVGENKLMPATPDCPSIVINGKNGFVRQNQSWILGRVLRDFDFWKNRKVSTKLEEILDSALEAEKAKAQELAEKGETIAPPTRPTQAGLCISIYTASTSPPHPAGTPTHDLLYFSGLFIATIQLVIACVPCFLFGDWGILLITATGNLLALVTGFLPQWRAEKWACRRKAKKNIILTRGNGSQHAIVILSNGDGLDLEDLAAGPLASDAAVSRATRIVMMGLAVLWILLLISVSGQKDNPWYLLAVGGLGMVHNVTVAGARRKPSNYGIHIDFQEVIGDRKVMAALFQVEDKYPRVGKSMLKTFFPGDLRHDEVGKWEEFAKVAERKDKEEKRLARREEERKEEKREQERLEQAQKEE